MASQSMSSAVLDGLGSVETAETRTGEPGRARED